MTTRVPADTLHAILRQVLEAAGAAPDAAVTTADVLLYADLHGFTTHGSVGLSTIYVPRLLDGRIDPIARARVVQDSGACAVVDGQHALGHPTMVMATDVAIAKARRHGIAMVAVRRSSHFGSAGYYARRAADAGLVALTMTNCGGQGVTAPLGGTRRMLGTNPIAAAVPAPGGAPFVLDMSTTTVASGKIRAARFAGRPVPPGWLTDGVGGDVADPHAFFDGRAELTWLGGERGTGGAKGYGLAVLVDLLCGPLAGADFGPRPRRSPEAVIPPAPARPDPGGEVDDPRGQGIGHTVIVIDPDAFGAGERLAAQARELLDALSDDVPAVPATPVSYAGAPDEVLARRAHVEGVPLPHHVLTELFAVAHLLGVPVPDGLGMGAAA